MDLIITIIVFVLDIIIAIIIYIILIMIIISNTNLINSLQDEETLKYVPGREYFPALMPKGKEKDVSSKQGQKAPKVYLWEERVNGIPVSRSKIDDFLKENNRGLVDYVKETTETAKEDFDEEEDMETDIEENQDVFNNPDHLEDSDDDEVEELMREAEEEDWYDCDILSNVGK